MTTRWHRRRASCNQNQTNHIHEIDGLLLINESVTALRLHRRMNYNHAVLTNDRVDLDAFILTQIGRIHIDINLDIKLSCSRRAATIINIVIVWTQTYRIFAVLDGDRKSECTQPDVCGWHEQTKITQLRNVSCIKKFNLHLEGGQAKPRDVIKLHIGWDLTIDRAWTWALINYDSFCCSPFYCFAGDGRLIVKCGIRRIMMCSVANGWWNFVSYRRVSTVWVRGQWGCCSQITNHLLCLISRRSMRRQRHCLLLSQSNPVRPLARHILVTNFNGFNKIHCNES